MNDTLSLSQFLKIFPSDDTCFNEIKRLKFPKGIYCTVCEQVTKHYKVASRPVYSCTYCRRHVSPLANTIFEKTTTSLKLWFFAMFLMTHSRATISKKQLQRELGVTYKTAWRMHTTLFRLMQQNNGDLLKAKWEIRDPKSFEGNVKVRRWTFFNKLEITLSQKEEKVEE